MNSKTHRKHKWWVRSEASQFLCVFTNVYVMQQQHTYTNAKQITTTRDKFVLKNEIVFILVRARKQPQIEKKIH